METDQDVSFASAILCQVFLCNRLLRLTFRKQKEEGCGRHEKNEILEHAKRQIAVVCAIKSKNSTYDLKSHKTKKRDQNQ